MIFMYELEMPSSRKTSAELSSRDLWIREERVEESFHSLLQEALYPFEALQLKRSMIIHNHVRISTAFQEVPKQHKLCEETRLPAPTHPWIAWWLERGVFMLEMKTLVFILKLCYFRGSISTYDRLMGKCHGF